MYLSQTENLLKRLRLKGTESANTDCKEYLSLESAGDHATFIRHIAAFANTGRKGHLLIGVENKTWAVKGIAEGSPLRDADATQQQMNHILAKRLDPPLDIRYWTYDTEGSVIGVVEVNGKTPPYIVSVENPEYGGNRTRGGPRCIYNGVIYVRHGDSSVVANRQSEILRVLEGRRDILGVITNLVFVAVLVGTGVSIGAGALKFSTPGDAAILGSVWGMLIGWIFGKRVAETLGGFFGDSTFREVARNIASPAWGALIGSIMSYTMVDAILKGEASALNPVMLGLIIGPMVAVLTTLAVAAGPFAVYIAIRTVRTVIEVVNFLKRKRA